MADDSSDDEAKRPVNDEHPWYPSILDKLSCAGYHRARFARLPDYQKVAGGLVYAMSHFDNPLCAALKFDETDNSDREGKAAEIIRALQSTDCPYKFRVIHLVRMRCEKMEPVVRWCMEKFMEQAYSEKNYAYFSEYFKKEYPNAKAASIDYRHRLHHPNSNFDYCAAHWEIFDNNIIFQQDLNAKTTLTQYYHYAIYGESIYPEKYIQLPTEDEAQALEHLAGLAKDKKECVAELKKLSETIYHCETDNRKNVFAWVCSKVDKMNAATKFYYFEKRFLIDGEQVFQVITENRVLEKNVKIALENSLTFDVDAMEKLHEQLKKLNQRAKDFYVAVLKDLSATSTKEHELRMNKKNGVVQRYSVARRELCDAYTEKRQEIEKIARRVFKMVSRLTTCSKQAEGCRQRFNEMKAKHERAARDNYDDFKRVDKGIVIQLNTYTKLLHKHIQEVKADVGKKNDDAEDFRETFISYASDVKNLVDDWICKAKILETKFKEAICRNNKLKLMFSKVQGESLFAAAEYEKMFGMTRAIQEVGYELNQLESITGEFKKPCPHK